MNAHRRIAKWIESSARLGVLWAVALACCSCTSHERSPVATPAHPPATGGLPHSAPTIRAVEAPPAFPDTMGLGAPWQQLGKYQPSTLSPSPDILAASLSSAAQKFIPRDSAWQAADRKALTQLLSQRTSHTLVVPAQVQGFGTDRISRSLWTADLTYALSEAGVEVADPFLVMRALGEGDRTLPPSRVDDLAIAVHASQIVETYIGHDRNHHLTVLVKIHDKADGSKPGVYVATRVVSWSSLPFSDQDPPALVLQRLVPELVAKLLDHPRGQAGPAAGNPAADTEVSLAIPVNPLELVRANGSGPDAPLRLALLAALTPSDSALARERLYEKTLISLERGGLPTDQTSFFRALALFKLQMRPAALAALSTAPASPAIEALRAIMDGNLTGTDALVAQVNGVERPLLAIELNDLRALYQQQKGPESAGPADPEVTRIARRGPLWQVLVDRRLEDLQSWKNGNNVQLKAILDALFPIEGMSLRDLVAQGRAMVDRRSSGVELDVAVLKHVRTLAAGGAHRWTAAAPHPEASPWDLLSVIEADAEANLLKGVEFQLLIQGSPDEAVAELDRLESYYGGHPEFAAWRASADAQLAHDTPADQRPRYEQAAQEAAQLAIYWAQGQTSAALRALGAGPDHFMTFGLARAYSYDFPGRSFWLLESNLFYGSEAARKVRAADALSYTQADPSPAFIMQTGNVDDQYRQQGKAAVDKRFLGNAAVQHARAVDAELSQSSDQRRRALLAVIKSDPDNWQTYMDLGSLMIEEQGDYAGAAKLYGSYPPFRLRNAEGETVTLSNYAYDAARDMYWRGEVESARQLYAIAARFDNGSDASMTAAQRLKTMQGDFQGALQIAAARVDRYQDEFSHRDLITLLYALKQPDQAAAAFEAVAGNPEGSAAWQAALTGQRMSGLSDAHIYPWIQRHVERSEDPRIGRYGATLLLLWNLSDRVPPRELPEQVRKLMNDPIGTAQQIGTLYPSPETPNASILVHQSVFRSGDRRASPQGTRIDSDLTLFARAYVALRYQEYAQAVTLFEELAAHVPIDQFAGAGASASYAVPYFAYASSKSGDPLQLESYLSSQPELVHGFDDYLAMALFAAARHNADQALDDLQRAYNRMPQVGDRPILIDQQLAEVCEWLFDSLGDPRFREFELDFARRYRVVNPFRAWPYAVIAQAAKDPAARAKALGTALFLDPGSTRLQAFAPAELAAARGWASRAHPFDKRPKVSPGGTVVRGCCARTPATVAMAH